DIHKNSMASKLSEKANASDVYTKSNVDSMLSKKANQADLDKKADKTTVTTLDTKVNKISKNLNKKANKSQVRKIKNAVEQNTRKIENNREKIQKLNKRIDKIENKLNKGLSLMTAMSAIDFNHVPVGKVAIGAGIGHYSNSQSVAIGFAYSPNENIRLNSKYSVSTDDIETSAFAVGGTYIFN
ncbi:YadA-like C-terminal region, partial [Cetobacterium ceti]